MREIVSPRREEQDNCLIFGQSKCILTKRNCISNNHFIESRICNFFYGVAGENRVRCVGKHSLGAAGLKGICSMAKCSCCINDVIDDYAGASFDFSDDIHNFGNVSSGAAFVDNGEIAFHALSDGTARTTPPTSGDTTTRSE